MVHCILGISAINGGGTRGKKSEREVIKKESWQNVERGREKGEII